MGRKGVCVPTQPSPSFSPVSPPTSQTTPPSSSSPLLSQPSKEPPPPNPQTANASVGGWVGSPPTQPLQNHLLPNHHSQTTLSPKTPNSHSSLQLPRPSMRRCVGRSVPSSPPSKSPFCLKTNVFQWQLTDVYRISGKPVLLKITFTHFPWKNKSLPSQLSITPSLRKTPPHPLNSPSQTSFTTHLPNSLHKNLQQLLQQLPSTSTLLFLPPPLPFPSWFGRSQGRATCYENAPSCDVMSVINSETIKLCKKQLFRSEWWKSCFLKKVKRSTTLKFWKGVFKKKCQTKK